MKVRSLAFLFPLCFAASLFGQDFGQDIDSVVIPAKTEIFVTLQRAVSTKSSVTGDRFYGEVSVPVAIDDRIVIPVGASIIGHVDQSKKPGHLKGRAAMELNFDRLILPDGLTREIQAVVQSAENYPTSSVSQTEGTVVAEGSQGKETAAEAANAGVKGAVVGAIAGRSFKGAGLGGLIGAAGGAVLGVFKRGKDVELRKGDSVTIQLTDAVKFVRPEPAPVGESLDR